MGVSETQMKKLMAIIFTAIIVLTIPLTVKANEEWVDGVDIMVVIDKSWSMSWNDPNFETIEAFQHILNLSLGTGNRVGFVIYNDTIIASQGLQAIESLNDIDGILRELRDIKISRGTDVGLALKTVQRQLEIDNYRQGQTVMIILSDGDHEFEIHNPNRNHDDVMAEVEEVLTSISYPIYTVQYSAVERRDKAPKNEWGSRTGGANFSAMTHNEMIKVLNDIYNLITEMAEETILAARLEYEANLVHEHQLIIPNTPTETEYVESVEVTIMGEGMIQEIIIPADYENITVSMVETNHVITIIEPKAESYTISYVTSSVSPFEISTNTHMSKNPTKRIIPWEIIGIITSILVVLAILGLLWKKLWKKHQVKKAYPTLNSTLECYFMEVPTGTKDIPIQSWSATLLAANNKTSLDKLLKNVSLRSKMPEAERIFVSINYDNTISITNKAEIICYKDGKEVADKQITLHNGEGLYMVFQKNTIEIELRVRQSGLSYSPVKQSV